MVIDELAPAPGGSPEFVTTLDGRRVRITSDEWRLECEARRVCRKRSKSERAKYLRDVDRFRGTVAGDDLRAKIMEVWNAEFRRG